MKREWLEVWPPGQERPGIQDVTNLSEERLGRMVDALNELGWYFDHRTGTPPDMVYPLAPTYIELGIIEDTNKKGREGK